MLEVINNSEATQLRNLARNLKIDISDLKRVKGYKKQLRKRLRKEFGL